MYVEYGRDSIRTMDLNIELDSKLDNEGKSLLIEFVSVGKCVIYLIPILNLVVVKFFAEKLLLTHSFDCPFIFQHSLYEKEFSCCKS